MNEPVGKTREVPWIVHGLVVALIPGACLFFAPFLTPIILRLVLPFVALSTILFPLCRGSRTLFVLNYVVSAGVALVLFFQAAL